MNATTIEKELLSLERQYWQAIQDGDAQAAGKLSADPCIVTGAQGVGKLTRAQLVEMMDKDRNWKLESFEISNPIVQVVSDDVAAVAYKVSETLTVDGKPLTLEAAETSTWVRRDGSWVCAVHTESVAGDPFGRDRARGK
jgi:uncharacterized protein (TIGR02246 family)